MIAECTFEQTQSGFLICNRDSVYTFITGVSMVCVCGYAIECWDFGLKCAYVFIVGADEIEEWNNALIESVRLSAARVRAHPLCCVCVLFPLLLPARAPPPI